MANNQDLRFKRLQANNSVEFNNIRYLSVLCTAGGVSIGDGVNSIPLVPTNQLFVIEADAGNTFKTIVIETDGASTADVQYF